MDLFCTDSIFPLFSTEYIEIILLSVTKLLTFPLHGKSIYTSNPAFESFGNVQNIHLFPLSRAGILKPFYDWIFSRRMGN